MDQSSEDDVEKLKKLQAKPEQNIEHDDKKSIVITNLNPKTTKNDILDFLKSCGRIKDSFMRSNVNKKLPAKAYVEFFDQSSVEIALALDKTMLKNKIVRILKKQANKRACKKSVHNVRKPAVKK